MLEQDRGLLRGRGRREHPVADLDHRADPDDRRRDHGRHDRDRHVPADVQAADADRVTARPTRMMDRLVNFVLVGSVLAALVVGAVWIGSRVRDDSVSRLTESIPAAAAAATADSQLRAAVFAANAYFVQHSTYAGMTADKLRSEVDAGLAVRALDRGHHGVRLLRGDGGRQADVQLQRAQGLSHPGQRLLARFGGSAEGKRPLPRVPLHRQWNRSILRSRPGLPHRRTPMRHRSKQSWSWASAVGHSSSTSWSRQASRHQSYSISSSVSRAWTTPERRR